MKPLLSNFCGLRRICLVCLMLALAVPALCRVPKAQNDRTPPQKLMDLQQAIQEARSLLSTANSSMATAEAILNLPKTKEADKAALILNEIQQAAQTLQANDIKDSDALNALETALITLLTGVKDKTPSLSSQKNRLQALHDALDTDKDKLNGNGQRSAAEVALKEADEQIDKLQKAADRLAKIAIDSGDHADVLRQPIRGILDSTVSRIKEQVQALNNSALGSLKPDASAGEVRKNLLNGLKDAQSIADAYQSLQPVYTLLRSVLKEDSQPPADNALRDLLTAQAQKLRTFATALSQEADANAGKITTLLKNVQDALDKTPRDRGVIYDALATLRASRQQTTQMRDIADALENAQQAWKGTPYGDAAKNADVKTLNANADALANSNQYLGDLLIGDADRFVQDQARLFYFTDVPRLIQSINPDAALVTSEAVIAAQQRADSLRTQLLNTEDNIAALTEKKNQFQARKRDLQEKARLAQARLNDANNRLHIARTAQLALNEPTRLQEVLQTQINELNTTHRTALTDAQKSLTDQITTLKQQQDAAGDERNQAQIDRLQRAQDRNTAQQTALDAQIRRLKVRQSDLKVQASNLSAPTDSTASNNQPGSVQIAQNTVNSIQTEITRLQAELDGLPAQIDEIDKHLIDAQVARAGARRQQAVLAAQEAEAFGEFRDNQPFWLAPANAAASDPAKRVILYGYEDSKTIFLRGMARDVERVKEIIASFDRPAPQARVTLWTMQLNGSGKSLQFNRSIHNIDNILRDVRGSINIVQNQLRDSINEEVNRVAEITHQASENTARMTYSGRMARYFYYSKETRDALGFRPGLPDRRRYLATARYEMQAALKYYRVAKKKHDTFDTASIERRLIPKLRNERENHLREAGFHLRLAQNAIENIEKLDLSLALQVLNPMDASNLDNLAKQFHKLFHQVARDEEDRRDLDQAYKRAFLAAGDDAGLLRQIIQRVSDNVKTLLDPSKNLGIDQLPEGRNYADSEYVTRWTLPDPAHATTLGEMLFVLSLGERESRENILQHFILNMERQYESQQNGTDKSSQRDALARFQGAIRTLFGTNQPNSAQSNTNTQGYPHFPAIVLGGEQSDAPQDSHDHEMTANQLEILTALQAKARERVATEVRYDLRQIGTLYKNGTCQDPRAAKMLRDLYLPLVGYLHNKFYEEGRTPDTYKDTLWYVQGVQATQAAALSPTPADIQTDFMAWKISELVYEHNSLAQATPRVAAADDMIKRMIIVAEDDIDYFFVAPAFDSIRENAVAEGVELGTIQRESILATNRQVARVDPRASAALTLDNGTNFLDQAQQLAQIANRFQETQRAAKLTQTLPPLAGLLNGLVQGNPTTALAYGGVASLLGDLAARPQQPAGEVYSINTGSLFKITPIFDPSGQALRFKFDYSAVTNLQEPDGTTTPDTPRVDRHTINTEVQLTNLELREISRFESNSKLGTPAIRTGGLPIINQIPILRDIPLLGYYYRRKAEAASRQESLIFAQTSLYPTVGDIVDLLTDVPPRTDLNPEIPKYLQDKTDVPIIKTENGPALESLKVTPALQQGGRMITVMVKLTDKAPQGGAMVAITNNSTGLLLPVTLPVSAGKDAAEISIPTSAAAKVTPISVTGTYGGVSRSDALCLNPPTLQSLILTPDPTCPCWHATLVLDGMPPPQGIAVRVSCDHPGAKFDGVVLIRDTPSKTVTITVNHHLNPKLLPHTAIVRAAINGTVKTTPFRIIR